MEVRSQSLVRGPRENPTKWFSWGKEEPRNERAFVTGGSEGYEASNDAADAVGREVDAVAGGAGDDGGNTVEKLLDQLLFLGELLLQNGAEITRVEDTISRMGMAYGASEMHVFVITYSIVVTMKLPDGGIFTQTRRITRPAGTDFRRLEECNILSRRCCRTPLPLEELTAEIDRIRNRPSSRLLVYCSSMLCVGSFTLFFGGKPVDMLVAMAFAAVTCLLQEYLMPICMNRMIFNLICSLLIGIGACLCVRLYPVLQLDKIIIGYIMMLIPGLAMTNAIRDVLVGNTISGFLLLMESLLWAGALASGFMLAIWMTGGVV